MQRNLFRAIAVLLITLGLAHAYLCWSLDLSVVGSAILLIPFLLLVSVPLYFWSMERKAHSFFDDLLHMASYMSMGWLNFLFFNCIVKDLLSFGSSLGGMNEIHNFLAGAMGKELAFYGSLAALCVGWVLAIRGPKLKEVTIRVAGLDQRVDGMRIVQISDLHIGPTISGRYVRSVVASANAAQADLVVLTGDLVDGTLEKLGRKADLLRDLIPKEKVYLIQGNHDVYSGWSPWRKYFKDIGFCVLENQAAVLSYRDARLLIAGVNDPAELQLRSGPGPDLSQASVVPTGEARDKFATSILLAHNPKIAPLAEKFGFNIQLSGHTHAGQFIPWTFIVRLVHAPHYYGTSNEGAMQVYVSAGTGTWGPPIRLGTRPELTVITLKRG
jgi:predicted MPP superfamily phosphohydrolase